MQVAASNSSDMPSLHGGSQSGSGGAAPYDDPEDVDFDLTEIDLILNEILKQEIEKDQRKKALSSYGRAEAVYAPHLQGEERRRRSWSWRRRA